MSRFKNLLKILKVAFVIVLIIIGVVNLAMASIFVDWIVWTLIAVAIILVLLIYALAKLLYKVIFCSSNKKLKKVKIIVENAENLSEESLLLILDLSHADLVLLNTTQSFPSSMLLKSLGLYKQVLLREINTSKVLFDQAAEKMLKNVYYDEDMEIRTFSDGEWYTYLEAKLNYEQILLQRLVVKEKEIVKVCKLHNKNIDYESIYGVYRKQVENCSICLSEYDHHHKIVMLECKHYFHLTCLEDWMVEKQSCPLCKSEV